MRIQKQLERFFLSEQGEKVIGQIVLNAVNQALQREILFEDGKSDPGRMVEKKQVWNILDWLVKYIPHIEAAIRGCQADSAAARNRSNGVLSLLEDVLIAGNKLPIRQVERRADENVKQLPER